MANRVWPAALIVLLCLVLYAPGLVSIPPTDRDEARFAQASRQMLESGDFIRIRFQNHARDKKPAGIYWLQAASVSLFSTPESAAIWPYRLPSALGATAAALLTLALGAALFPDKRRAGLFAAVLTTSALGLVIEAHLAKTDAILLATIVAGQGALALVYLRARDGMPTGWTPALGFWVAEALAILSKGPVGPLIAVLTIAALSIVDRDLRWLRSLRPLAGFLLAAAIVLPWVVAIESATGGRFLSQAIGHDLLPKLIGGQESHGAPPGTYLALVTATFWPASLFLVPSLVMGWRRRKAPAERFLLAWLIPAWVVFELVPTKLPHYVLPLYPALALLAGRALAEGTLGFRRVARVADAIVKGLWTLVTLGLAIALVVLPLKFAGMISMIGIIGAILLTGLAAVMLLRRPAPAAAIGFAACLAVAFVLPAAAIVPRLDGLWLSRSAARLFARYPPSVGKPVVSVGYSEPSLVFLLGTKLRLTSPSEAAEVLAKGGAALVSARDAPGFRKALATHDLRVREEGRVSGLDYSTGREVALTLYQVAAG